MLATLVGLSMLLAVVGGRTGTPDENGAEYIAVCLPAFSMETVRRDTP